MGFTLFIPAYLGLNHELVQRGVIVSNVSEPAIPIPPCKIDARSVAMSPNMLE